MDNTMFAEPSAAVPDTYVIEMRPEYSVNSELNCQNIKFGDRTYFVNFEDFSTILNCKKRFHFQNSTDDYPSYLLNYKRYSFLNFLYKSSEEDVCFHFINGNKYDLRRCNVKLFHKMHNNIIDQYDVLEYIEGHYPTLGVDAYCMKNPMWVINEVDSDENAQEMILMYCEINTICKICPKSYEKILQFEKNVGRHLTWYLSPNGYISTHDPITKKGLYIHQIIMEYYGNGQGTKNISVDHIDRNPLNNAFNNLRLANRKEQEQNSKGIAPNTKRERQSNARDLPDGIEHTMLRKYVVYYHSVYDKSNNKSREYFRVDGHPKLDKPWESSKSGQVSILDKLAQANKVVDDLELDIYPQTYQELKTLPKYFSLIQFREKPHLVYERYDANKKRQNLKMVLPKDYVLQEQIEILTEKIKVKYPEHTFNRDI